MSIFFRFLRILLFSRFSSKINLLEESSIIFRVMPSDIDVLLHMNNGRYFSLMDLARFDFLIRARLLPQLKAHRFYAVVASEMIRFKKSLTFFQTFTITSQLVGWDEKFIYVQQYFKRGEELHALSLVKICPLHRDHGRVNPIEILKLLGHDHLSAPPFPEWIKQWQEADHGFYQHSMHQFKN